MDQFTWWQITLMIAFPIYLLLCGALGAYCSTERGRPGTEGFWFGVFLGPLGVVAAACMPERASAPPWPKQEDDEDVAARKHLERMKGATVPSIDQQIREAARVPRRQRALGPAEDE